MRKTFAILLVAALLITMLPSGVYAEDPAATNDQGPRTGLIAPTDREVKLFEDTAQVTEMVLPNTEGVNRINEALKQQGLPTYSASSLMKNYSDIPDLLPATVDLSLSGHFPAIGDQGYIGACSSFSTTYYAATYETAAKRNIDLAANPDQILSPKFCYNLNNDGEDTGSSIYGNLLTLYTRGAPFIDETSMTAYQYNGYDFIGTNVVNPLQYREYPQTAAIYNDALKNRIADIGLILDVNTTEGLDQIRQTINNGHVLVFGTDYIYDWQNDKTIADDPSTASDDAFVGQYVSDGMVVADTESYSGHSMTVVGYNDDLWVDIDADAVVDSFEKGALKIANSWGTEWGNDGFIWLSYDALQDANGHLGVIAGNEMVYIIAQDEYVPVATAEITLSTSRRDQFWLYSGVNWNEAGSPQNGYTDYVFSGHWGGDYSFAGTSAASTATVVIDLTDAITLDGFTDAGGMISLFAGVGDDTSDTFYQNVYSVVYKTDISTPTLERLPDLISNELKWYCGKANLNDSDPPPYDTAIRTLPVFPLNYTLGVSSYGPDDYSEWQFSPTVSGTYSFNNYLDSQSNGLEVLNSAREVLYSGTDSLELELYSGKTYILKSWYAGDEIGSSYYLTIKLILSNSASLKSSRLSSLSLTNDQVLSPAFSAATFDYYVNANSNYRVTATPEDISAYIVSGGQCGPKVDVNINENSTTQTRVEVTSSDWSKTCNYNIYSTIGSPSSLADLESLTMTTGEISPSFEVNKTDYLVEMPIDDGMTTLSVTAADANASIIINGLFCNYMDLSIDPGESQVISISVIAPDLVTVKKYNVIVRRALNFAADTYFNSTNYFHPNATIASPDSNTIFMSDNVGNQICSANLDSGIFKSLPLPNCPVNIAFAGGKLLVSMYLPTSGLDSVAIIDPTSLTIDKIITVNMDVFGFTADENYIYTHNRYTIHAYKIETGSQTSSCNCTAVSDIEINNVSSNLYTASSYAVSSYKVVDGVISFQKSVPYSAENINIMPDGQNLVCSNGKVMSCGAEAAFDLIYNKNISSGTAVVNEVENLIYVVYDRLIFVYDASDFSFVRTIPMPSTSKYILCSIGNIIVGTYDDDMSLIFNHIPESSMLKQLKVNGDAYSEFYPLMTSIDYGEVPNTMTTINIEAIPSYESSDITGDICDVELAVGENVLSIICTDQTSGESITYTFNVTRRESDPIEQTFDGRVNLGFTPLDMAIDPERPVVYLTEVDGNSLYRVDYETGIITEKSFPLIAEQISIKNGKIYLSLLRTGHVYSLPTNQNGYGAFAVIDASTFKTTSVFNTNLDPFDIEADEQGNVYLAPGSGQWSIISSYSGESGMHLSTYNNSVRFESYMDINPVTGKIYTITTDTSPRDIDAYEIANGIITTNYDSPYHGDYSMSTYMKISPDGSCIYNGSGNVFTSTPTQAGDMIYMQTLGDPFTTMCFDQTNNLFYTGNGNTLRSYSSPTNTALPALTSNSDFISLQHDGEKIIALQKNSNGDCYLEEYVVDTLLTSVSIGSTEVSNFDPLVQEYNISLATDESAFTIAAPAFDSNGIVSGDVGEQTINLGLNTFKITVTGGESGQTREYTINVTRSPQINANLSGLTISAGVLSPTFDPFKTSYTLTLSEMTSSTVITPTKYDSLAVMKINGVVATNKTVTIWTGASQDVTVEVTASDGVTKKTYTIHVVRSPSTSTNLYSLSITAGTLSPAFSASTIEYSVTIPAETLNFTISASASSMFATTRINGNTSAINYTTSVPGGTTRDYLIEVTAQDGISKKTYTVHVYRPATPVTGVTLNRNSIDLAIGGGLVNPLKVTIFPSTATNSTVTWSSSDSNIVEVNHNGYLCGLNKGTATVTATTVDGNFTASCVVTVKANQIESLVYPIDQNNFVISGISAGTTVLQLKSKLGNSASDLVIYTAAGDVYTGELIATNMRIDLLIDGVISDQLRLSVLGDVSGDGLINVTDILYIRADILDTYAMLFCQSPAADINKDGVINVTDILYIRAHILGTYTIKAK